MEVKLPRLSQRGSLSPLIGSLWSGLVTIIVIFTLFIIILAMIVISNIIMLPNQVLMLATFTANLAAFLTVERMQTTIQNLEELARFFLPIFLFFALFRSLGPKFQKLENEARYLHHLGDIFPPQFVKQFFVRQSKINYTVLKDSPYMEYFKVNREILSKIWIVDAENIDHPEYGKCGGGPLQGVEGSHIE